MGLCDRDDLTLSEENYKDVEKKTARIIQRLRDETDGRRLNAYCTILSLFKDEMDVSLDDIVAGFNALVGEQLVPLEIHIKHERLIGSEFKDLA